MRVLTASVCALFLAAVAAPTWAGAPFEILVADYRAAFDGDTNGVFEQFRVFPNDEYFSQYARNAWEFDLDAIPFGATILSAELTMTTSAFDVPRPVEVHWFVGNGTVELGDFAWTAETTRWPSASTLMPASTIIVFDVQAILEDLMAEDVRWLGFNVRGPVPSGETVITMTLPGFPGEPKLVVTYSGGIVPTTFDFDDATLQGFFHVLSDPGIQEWESTAEWPVGLSSGVYRVVPEPWDSNRDGPHNTLLLRSPLFVLESGGPLAVDLTGGQGAGSAARCCPSLPATLPQAPVVLVQMWWV